MLNAAETFVHANMVILPLLVTAPTRREVYLPGWSGATALRGNMTLYAGPVCWDRAIAISSLSRAGLVRAQQIDLCISEDQAARQQRRQVFHDLQRNLR